MALSCCVGDWVLLTTVILPGAGGGCAPAKAFTAARSAAPLPLPTGLIGGGGTGSSTAALAAARSAAPLPPPKVFTETGATPLPNGFTFSTFRSSEMKLLTAMYFCVTGYSKCCNVLGAIYICVPARFVQKKISFNFYHGTP